MNVVTLPHGLTAGSGLSDYRNGKIAGAAATARESQLIRLTANGDCQAFAALYDQYSKPLYSFAVHMLGDQLEAQDVLQEAFIKIWEKAGTFNEDLGHPFTWVVIITRNKAIDRLRLRQRQDQTPTKAAKETVMDEFATGADFSENETNRQSAVIYSVIDNLPENQRRPIELAFFGGLVHTEIAEKLQEPLGAIKARIRCGMLKLRDQLEW